MLPHGLTLSLEVANHADSLHISLAKGFLVGGDGVGGNFAAAVTLKARGDPFFATKRLTGQFLREPMVVCPNYMPIGCGEILTTLHALNVLIVLRSG